MSDIIEPSELETLKARADRVGIKYHPSIGIEALKEKLADKLGMPNTSETPTTTITLREVLMAEQLKLIRVRLSCNNPLKKDLQGEVITVDNQYVGTVRKYIPYGSAMDAGYHIPECILNVLRERQFIRVTTRKDIRGNAISEAKYVPEYSIDILPPLSKEELAELAKLQLATGSIE
jgi:hypothetical protein